MDTKTVVFAVVLVILVIVAAVGFVEYGMASGKVSSLQSQISSLSAQLNSTKSAESSLQSSYASLNSSYASLQSKYQTISSELQSLMSQYQSLNSSYSQLSSRYASLESTYMALLQKYESLQSVNVSTLGASMSSFFQALDGIAIESPTDVTQFLAPNFTATVMGTPFPGTYNLNTFNSTWLAQFFSNYETVYFYTTALPSFSRSGNVYTVSAVVQYFVAPTNDPILLQVFNASVTANIVNGRITQLTWIGNELPPSSVIAGYPSQHSMQATQATELVLSQLNAMGAEFPANVISSGFAPGGTLTITGSLPPVFKTGTYMGSNITKFFQEWDTYFVFAVMYSQNLLPNRSTVGPMVSVTLSPSQASAVVTANDSALIGFVASGQPNFPMIYDIHFNVTAHLAYNTTTATWQIVSETLSSSMVPLSSDAPGYTNTPTFIVNGIQTVQVNASKGAVLQVGNLIAIVKPGTYAQIGSTMESVYNFSLVTFSMEGVSYPGEQPYLTPLFAYAFEVNGQITPAISLVNASGAPDGVITVVMGAPATWTSWTWFGGNFNGTVYTGGAYKFPDSSLWVYGPNVMVNLVFFKPVIWIFESAPQAIGHVPTQVNIKFGQAFNLTPIAAYTYTINGTTGGVVAAGDTWVVVQPHTIIQTPTANLTVFNFSVVFYAPQNVTAPSQGQVPSIVFAYAVNGNVTFSDTASKPFITVMVTPDQGANMWTWNGKTYIFHVPILLGNGIIINLIFVKPVPWVVTLPESYTNTSSSSSSSSGGYYY
jgi:Uncharacterized protein involved in exopolysaccharide biosynthesis